MKTKLWSYWRIAKRLCGNVPDERITSAKRQAPSGYTLISSRGGQYTFRKRLPDHVLASWRTPTFTPLHGVIVNDTRAPY